MTALVRKFSEASRLDLPSVTLWGTGLATREFLFVKDCASAIVQAVTGYVNAGADTFAFGGAYQGGAVGQFQSTSFNKALQVTNTSNTLIFVGGPYATNVARTNSPTDVVLGANRLVSLYPDLVSAAFLPPFVPA